MTSMHTSLQWLERWRTREGRSGLGLPPLAALEPAAQAIPRANPEYTPASARLAVPTACAEGAGTQDG